MDIMKILLSVSEKAAILPTATADPIHVYCQYFLPATDARRAEIQKCLRLNVANPHISSIYLLNERIYTDEELGISDPKIIQVNIGRRLRFSDVFAYITSCDISGFAVIVNSDIYLDDTIAQLRVSDIRERKKMLALLRYDVNGSTSTIFGPRHDSQDTWILHSSFMIRPEHQRLFEFEFGKPGCDNKLAHMMMSLGYTVVNDPTFIKTYHLHETQQRTYSHTDRVTPPFTCVVPYGFPISAIAHSLNINMVDLAEPTRNFTEIRMDDNIRLHDYILGKFTQGRPFIIPRAELLDTTVAVLGEICRRSGTISPQIADYFNNVLLLQESGIRASTHKSILRFSDRYMKAFAKAELICCHEFYGLGYLQNKQTYDYLRHKFGKARFTWNAAYDIFSYIQGVPWTVALRGKRLLIIAKDAAKIQAQLPHHEKIYGINLFPDCTITTIGFGGETHEFYEEMATFTERLDKIKGQYDVALVSCGGFGNLICNHIVEQGRSAICVGNVLPMYFGIMGDFSNDIISFYKNSFWI